MQYERSPSSGAVMRMLEEHLACSSSSWSIGVPGAIAEFHRDESDPSSFDGPGCVVTELGALRLDVQAAVRAHAYEILSAHPKMWHHGIALSLPADSCAMSGRREITELGPDREAIRPQGRDGVLFDLGLGSAYCDYYVRTADPAHIAHLRRAVGTSLLHPCCELYDDIVRMSPHRVFVSKLARIEIYQRIGKPGDLTPHGPHTHLMPKLFRPARTHFSHTALPAGETPCMTLYPANPVFDDAGRSKPFDRAQHEAFQTLLGIYGDANDVAVKRMVWRAVRAGAPPGSIDTLTARRERIAARVALRQLLHSDGSSTALSQWRSALERGIYGRGLAGAGSGLGGSRESLSGGGLPS